MNILISWIGSTDLKCATANAPDNLGPVMQAIRETPYDRVVLLSNFSRSETGRFADWVGAASLAPPEMHFVQLSSPTNHKEIYGFARNLVRAIQREAPDAGLTFHSSPGTPAMALSWFLLAPVFGARVIESSRQYGVKTVTFPFEVAAYFLPDADIARLTHVEAAAHPAFAHILHQSEKMRMVVTRALRTAIRDVPVYIEGESGTGKELFARAIHEASSRAGKPFVPVNCGAFPPELIESMLFGYVKGAFSGAVSDRGGFFQAAHTGTLFLDELEELPPRAQVSLLRAIQEGKVTPVGDTRERPVDVRIVAASNRSLMEDIRNGNFRSDLFYRIAVACLHLPPLRERGGDAELLLQAALDHANRELGSQGQQEQKKFSDSAKKIMLAYPWPGNVRELYNTVMRAALWTEGPVINAASARQALLALETPAEFVLDRPLGNGFSLKVLLADISRHYIGRALEEAHGVKATAAALLGFKNYQTLCNWIERYGK